MIILNSLLILVGIVAIFYALCLFLKQINFKNLSISKLLDSNDKVLSFNEIGTYSIAFIGGGYMKVRNDFTLNLSSLRGNKRVNAEINNIKFRLKYKGTLGVEFYTFSIDEIGEYILRVGNFDSLIMKSSMLSSVQLFQKPINISEIEIVLKKSLSIKEKIAMIICFVAGLFFISIGAQMLFPI